MCGVEVPYSSLLVPSEDGHCRVLIAVFALAAQVVLEAAVAGAEESEVVPTPAPRVLSERARLRRRDDREVNVLLQVAGNAIQPIDPQGAHGARRLLTFSVHEVVDDEGTVRPREELGKADLTNRLVAGGE